jgi:hypothetical protein
MRYSSLFLFFFFLFFYRDRYMYKVERWTLTRRQGTRQKRQRIATHLGAWLGFGTGPGLFLVRVLPFRLRQCSKLGLQTHHGTRLLVPSAPRSLWSAAHSLQHSRPEDILRLHTPYVLQTHIHTAHTHTYCKYTCISEIHMNTQLYIHISNTHTYYKYTFMSESLGLGLHAALTSVARAWCCNSFLLHPETVDTAETIESRPQLTYTYTHHSSVFGKILPAIHVYVPGSRLHTYLGCPTCIPLPVLTLCSRHNSVFDLSGAQPASTAPTPNISGRRV